MRGRAAALRLFPLWKPLPGIGGAAVPFWETPPLGKGRGNVLLFGDSPAIWGKFPSKDQVVCSEAEHTGLVAESLSFLHRMTRCGSALLQRKRYTAVSRSFTGFVGSSYRSLPHWVSWRLRRSTHPATFFLFHRARPIFFWMSQKENAVCIFAMEHRSSCAA